MSLFESLFDFPSVSLSARLSSSDGQASIRRSRGVVLRNGSKGRKRSKVKKRRVHLSCWGRFALVGVGSADAHVKRARCKMRSCPSCQKWIRNVMVDSLQHYIGAYSLFSFVTLTHDPERVNAWAIVKYGVPAVEDTGKWRTIHGRSVRIYKVLHDVAVFEYDQFCWEKMLKRLKRVFGKHVPYVWVRERHKSGVVHRHLLLPVGVTESWFSKAWSECGGGSDVYKDDNGHPINVRVKDFSNSAVKVVAIYVSKYLTKQAEADAYAKHGLDESVQKRQRRATDNSKLPLPHGFRAYGTSQGLKLMQAHPPPGCFYRVCY